MYNDDMLLKDYLKKEDYTQLSFLDMVEMATGNKIPQSTFAKWITGVRIPRRDDMLTIYKITEGEVEPNDFYGINNES